MVRTAIESSSLVSYTISQCIKLLVLDGASRKRQNEGSQETRRETKGAERKREKEKGAKREREVCNRFCIYRMAQNYPPIDDQVTC